MSRNALLLLLAAAVTACSQTRDWALSREVSPDDVLKHFPLQVGNRWIYETVYLTGDPEKPHVDRWRWEVRITRTVQTPDGLVVFRKRRELQVFEGQPYDQSGLRADPYFVTKGYVYEFDPDYWDEATQSLPREYIESLRAGKEEPAFFFPMRVGLLWSLRQQEDEEWQEWIKSGKAPDGFYHWHVIEKGGSGHCECMQLPPGAFDVLYFANNGPSEFFFQDGVGVIGEWNHHEGTYWDVTTKLKQFIPAGRGAKMDSPVRRRAQ